MNAELLPSPALGPPYPVILASVPLDILEHYRGSQRLLVDREWHLLRFSGLDVNTNAWKCSQIVEFLKIPNRFQKAWLLFSVLVYASIFTFWAS